VRARVRTNARARDSTNSGVMVRFQVKFRARARFSVSVRVKVSAWVRSRARVRISVRARIWLQLCLGISFVLKLGKMVGVGLAC
jgi:hypothetical protein